MESPILKRIAFYKAEIRTARKSQLVALDMWIEEHEDVFLELYNFTQSNLNQIIKSGLDEGLGSYIYDIISDMDITYNGSD